MSFESNLIEILKPNINALLKHLSQVNHPLLSRVVLIITMKIFINIL